MQHSTYESLSHVDTFVAARLRLLRQERRMSQTALGKAVGVTFQQIQKYEHAQNRISAAMLYELARALGAPIDYFYQDLEEPRAVA